MTKLNGNIKNIGLLLLAALFGSLATLAAKAPALEAEIRLNHQAIEQNCEQIQAIRQEFRDGLRELKADLLRELKDGG